MLCLCDIQKSWMLEGVFDSEKQKPLIADGWGIQFWNTCSRGSSILEITGTATSREQVRSLCKPLKVLGIHTVSLHNGAALDHQVHSLRSCEPEFLVATPERLLELVSSKAIDISGVSLLQHIQGDPQTHYKNLSLPAPMANAPLLSFSIFSDSLSVS